MTQTAAVASSVAATAGSGMSGVGGADLGGLFSLLMGFNAVPADGQAQVPGVMATLVNDAALGSGEAVPQSFQLGDGPLVQVQGDTLEVSAYLQQVQQVYRQLVVQGGLTLDGMSDAKELAGALTKLGMEPEVAGMVAERIHTMLEMLKQQQQGMDSATEGTMAAMMLTALLPQQATAAQGTGSDAAAVQVEISSLTRATVVRSFQHIQLAGLDGSAAGVTRELMGLGKDAAKAEGLAEGSGGAAVPVPSAAPRELLVSVSAAPREVSSVAVSVPQAADMAARQVEVVAPAVEKVSADKVIEKARGDVLYKWQADGSGNELLQAVQPPQGASQDAGVNAQAQQGMLAQMNAQAVATDGQDLTAGFADRLAEARQAAVGHQVAVQLKPLAEQGGGAIRMTLNPPELGQVQIDLTVTDGKVHGTIAAAQPAVVEQLARDLHSLRQGLADAGLKLGDQGISLMLSNNQSGNHQQGQHQGQPAHQQGQGAGGGWSGGGAEAVADAAELAAPVAPGDWVAPERVVDVRV